MKQGARFIAIEVLCKWEESRQSIDLVMERILKSTHITDPRESHLIFALVYGIIRWRIFLDRVLAKYSTHPLNKMKMRTLQTLRVGLFQLVFMDRIPASAAIDECVKALKAAGQPRWLSGFVNGLLRGIERDRANLPDPWDINDSSVPLAARFNHPEWIFSRFCKRFGLRKAKEICLSNNKPAPLCLRVNTKLIVTTGLIEMLERAGISARTGSYARDAVWIDDNKGPISEIPGYSEGYFWIQDEAAQLTGLLMGPLAEGKRYLDGCAGVGGKTCQLAGMLPAESFLTAVEPSNQRAGLLEENLKRLGFSRQVTILHSRLNDLHREHKGRYDGVMIDAPCSGLGVLRRHPDIRWNRGPRDLSRFKNIQLALLETARDIVAAKGCLVYVVCSREPEENEEVIGDFLARHHNFSLSDCREFLPHSCARFVDTNGCFSTIPGEEGLDGFYSARLVRMD